MIKSFADKETQKLWEGGRSKAVPTQLLEKAEAKLISVDAATNVYELNVPPSNHPHKLGGERKGQWAINIDKQFRVCFEFDEEAGDAYDVEIVDYH